MKHLKYIPLVLILFLVACKSGNRKSICYLYTTKSDVTLSTPIDSLLQLFTADTKDHDCQYFLITYLSSNCRIVTFIANNVGENYVQNKKPLFYFEKNDTKIYFITGIEDLFSANLKQTSKIERSRLPRYFNIRSYVIYKDSIQFIPKGIPPFAPPPSLEMENASLTK